jgi:hypothetical protein
MGRISEAQFASQEFDRLITVRNRKPSEYSNSKKCHHPELEKRIVFRCLSSHLQIALNRKIAQIDLLA